MRISIKAGRRLALALFAGALLSGSALTAATLPAQAAAARPAVAPETVTVTNPGTKTEPLHTVLDVPLSAVDSVPADYPLTWSASPNLTTLGLSVVTTNNNGTAAAITGDVPPADAGTYQITLTATDSGTPMPAADTVTFTLNMANTVKVTNPGAQASRPNVAIAPLDITASDTATTETLTFSATGLPPGLTIDPATGAISGTPTTVGKYTPAVTATDDTAAADTVTFTWTVAAPDKVVVTAPTKTQAVWAGVPVSLKPSATDTGTGQKLTWTITTPPPGLAINAATGAITGRPTKVGPFTSVLKATDGTGAFGTATVKWTVAVPVVIPNPGTLTTTVGSWLAINPLRDRDAVPGDRPSFSASGLPAGLGFQASPMLIYGWPNASGTYSVTIHERGSLGTTDAMTFKLVVRPAANAGGTGPDVGGVGQIHLPFAGKCLQDPGNRTANGTKVAIEPCVSGATERWTVAGDNTVRANGRCLTVAGSGASSGRQLVLEGCNGSARQRWAQGTDGTLANPASGLCVTDPGARRGNGTVPVLGPCRVTAAEQWTLPAQAVLTALGGSCLDDRNSSGVNGNVIDMFWCTYSGSKWTFATDGTIRMFGNKCVTASGGRAVIWTCGQHSGQRWAIARTSAMGSEITEGGVCLAIPSMTAGRGTVLEPNGTQLITSRCGKTDPRDLWHIE